jgi:GT2 family glycosyltransferase
MKIELSIVIVNHNAEKLLIECLGSVYQKIENLSFEIFVVDNNSSDNSVIETRKKFPRVKIIENKKNVGFVRANNQAIEKSTGNYIFLLNPDTFLLTNIKEIINFLESNNSIGCCGPLVLNKDLTMQRQCKRGFPTPWTAFTYVTGLWRIFSKFSWGKKIFGSYFLLNKSDEERCEVDQISGSAMIVKRKVIETVGLLNEDYVMYWEDSDWCFRIKDAGYKIYYYPSVKIIHYGGQGGSQFHVIKNLYYFHRGSYIFYRKHLSPKYFFIINFIYYIAIFSSFLIKFILNLFKKKKVIGPVKPS